MPDTQIFLQQERSRPGLRSCEEYLSRELELAIESLIELGCIKSLQYHHESTRKNSYYGFVLVRVFSWIVCMSPTRAIHEITRINTN